jgi:hypothetical protein
MNMTQINETIAALRPEYFLDENHEPFSFLRDGIKIIALPICSGSFQLKIQQEVKRVTGNYIGLQGYKTFKMECVYSALTGGKTRPLPVRVGKDEEGNIIYDLRREDGQQVVISQGGWSIEPQRVVFRDVGSKVPLPVIGGDIGMLDKYLTIQDLDQRLLTKVAIISMFFPNISHPVLVLNGEQGSGKTCLSKIIKRIIDPSCAEVLHLVNNVKDTQLTLANGWLTAFDNLSGISNEISDFFCGVVTGQAVQRRKLFTDSEMLTTNLWRCLILNGICGIVKRPDLLDRSLLIDLRRFTDAERKQESQIFESLDHELPYILGAIFDVLSEAMAIYHPVEGGFEFGGRLTDFAAHGYAIAEALDVGGDRFKEAYKANGRAIATEIIEENPVVEPLIAFLADQDLPKEIQVSKLFSRLMTFVGNHYEPYVCRQLPQSSQRFSRELKRCLGSIETRGYRICFLRRAEGTFMHISRCGNGKVDGEGHAFGDNIPPVVDNDPPNAA